MTDSRTNDRQFPHQRIAEVVHRLIKHFAFSKYVIDRADIAGAIEHQVMIELLLAKIDACNCPCAKCTDAKRSYVHQLGTLKIGRDEENAT